VPQLRRLRMSEREYEEQPVAPDLAAVLDEQAEYTMSGPPGGDLHDAGYVPPDRPYALDDDHVSTAGARRGDTLEERLRRERPDVPAADAEGDRAGRLQAFADAPDTWNAASLDAVDVAPRGAPRVPRRLRSTCYPPRRWARHPRPSPPTSTTMTCSTTRWEWTTVLPRIWSSALRKTSGSDVPPPATT
ncbi:MAG: hypothetical protein ACRDTA_12060, partial [Pseudonocardiaceae bacterium]